MNILHQICQRKAEHVESQKTHTPLTDIKSMAAKQSPPRGFIKALQASNFPAVIAEVKKASPSKGVIRADFNPEEIAKTYEENGAACLSVLTDEPYFQGSDSYLKRVHATVNLPVLRKDFMIDPYQIYESRALGADCILLIMAALSDEIAQNMHDLAQELGMDVLVEIHDEQELERAIALKPKMIGINNRNLKTLEVSIKTSLNLADQIPSDIIRVAESGLSDFSTLETLKNKGFSTFLIGENLMRADNIGDALQKIRGCSC